MSGVNIEKALRVQARKWAGVKEPERSELLSLFGERLITSPHLPVNYLARKVRAEVFRKKSLEKLTQLGTVEDELNLEDTVIIHTALEKLSLDQRLCIEMIYLGGSTLSDVAEELRVSLWGARKLRDQGLEILREELKDAPEE